MLIGSIFRVVTSVYPTPLIFRIICHVFLSLPEYCRVFVTMMLEETTNLIFITGWVISTCVIGRLSLQIVFLVQIYYALLNLAQPAIRKVFVGVIMSVGRYY